MRIVTTVAELQQAVNEYKTAGKRVGFVPTMGALHAGHLQLVKRAIDENGASVVSIFVNPTQFNNPNDLINYPRTLEQDGDLLRSVGCDLLFAPTVEEIYPEPDTRQFELGSVAEVMEGKFRPGHFNGVAQVVSKLFDMVKPHVAYFGEKDFQQIAVIRSMVKLIDSKVEVIACPIVREADGVALSSRNRRLSAHQRSIAPLIAQTLMQSVAQMGEMGVAECIAFVTEQINASPELEVEYFEIVNGDTLMPITSWDEAEHIVGCITVYCGEIRLIDNIAYKK